MNGSFFVRGSSKERGASPSIFFTNFTEKDAALLVRQIGSPNPGKAKNFSPRFVLGVARRCPHGNAQVLLCGCMKDDLPFPTSFWLVCPHLVRAIGRLEARQGVASMEAVLAGKNDAAWFAFHVLHARIRMRLLGAVKKKFMKVHRRNMYRSLRLGGIGGISYEKGKMHVKCLHLQVASFLGLRRHPAEEWLRENVSDWACSQALCGSSKAMGSPEKRCDKAPGAPCGFRPLPARCGGRVLLVKYENVKTPRRGYFLWVG